MFTYLLFPLGQGPEHLADTEIAHFVGFFISLVLRVLKSEDLKKIFFL